MSGTFGTEAGVRPPEGDKQYGERRGQANAQAA